jgi:hypothetical protein
MKLLVLRCDVEGDRCNSDLITHALNLIAERDRPHPSHARAEYGAGVVKGLRQMAH